ncbi:MAG TPA: SGNH/GDSL hydrolase family protein [Candidatus Dormibacteraeota bacterium]|nr:SGNH/GDSL hydrolase family protein [Candidatus Dormibacteraeota bacterium]
MAGGEEKPFRYLALGDSYTICTGSSDRSRAWPSIVAARLEKRLSGPVELSNPAVNGYTTLDLIRDELPLVERLRPQLVSVLIGVNDLVQGRTLAMYDSSLSEIYDALAGARVFAISIPRWDYTPAAAGFGGADHVGRLTRLFNDIAREQAVAHGFAWVDIGDASRAGIGSKGWIASDELHPGDAQYAAWADVIWEAMSRGI